MSTPTDYTKLAASLDYAALDKQLTQLSDRQPPKRRKTAADVLEPVRERLLALHRSGWTSAQLAQELKAAGVPVSPARLRECLNSWADGGGGNGRRRARRQAKPAPNPTETDAVAPSTLVRKPVIPSPQSPFTLR